MNIFTYMFYSKEAVHSNKVYEKQRKEKDTVLTTKLN
jgi:hypothetical protein